MTLRNSRVLFLLVFLFWIAGIARADAIFNFNSEPVGSDFYGPSTTFSNTSNGLTATFSSPAFPWICGRPSPLLCPAFLREHSI